MGLFGNYNKEGPGIAKDAPKKRGLIVFFETYFRNIWKMMPIGVLYLLISLPLLTSGLAAVGITHVARNTARDKHSFGISDFFDTIKKNWKQALAAGIINTIIYALLIFDAFYFWFMGTDTLNAAGFGIIMGLLFIFTVMNYYMWTLIITFKFTLKQIYKNSFKFVFINLKWNFLCFIIETLVLAIYIFLPYAFLFSGKIFYMVMPLLFFIFILTFPFFKFLMEQYFVFPSIKKNIIDPYYELHPDDDIEKRRNLGLEVPGYDDDDDEEEDVFNDNIIE